MGLIYRNHYYDATYVDTNVRTKKKDGKEFDVFHRIKYEIFGICIYAAVTTTQFQETKKKKKNQVGRKSYYGLKNLQT